MNVCGWTVVNTAATSRGDVPLDQLTAQERMHLVEKIYLSVARALAPAGVQVRGVRLRRRTDAENQQRRAV